MSYEAEAMQNYYLPMAMAEIQLKAGAALRSMLIELGYTADSADVQAAELLRIKASLFRSIAERVARHELALHLTRALVDASNSSGDAAPLLQWLYDADEGMPQ